MLDFSLSVEELLTAHPTANIIASADIRQGLINTGLLVLRNSEWTKNFLLQWLSIADTKTVCDQIAFDQVYRQRVALGESLSDDIAILPMNFLNSFPPAMLHQQDSDPVLHLMGETSAMRSAAFATAWNAICDAKDQGVLAPQLGLSRNKLLKIAR